MDVVTSQNTRIPEHPITGHASTHELRRFSVAANTSRFRSLAALLFWLCNVRWGSTSIALSTGDMVLWNSSNTATRGQGASGTRGQGASGTRCSQFKNFLLKIKRQNFNLMCFIQLFVHTHTHTHTHTKVVSETLGQFSEPSSPHQNKERSPYQ